MSADQERFQYLLSEYRHNRLDQTGWEEFRALVQEDRFRQFLDEDFQMVWNNAAAYPGWTPAIDQEMWAQINESIQTSPGLSTATSPLPKYTAAPIRRMHAVRKWSAVAAAILLVLGISWLLYRPQPRQQATIISDVPPGSNKATLTLANGHIVTLDSAASSTISEQNGAQLIQLAGGRLSYNKSDISHPTSAISYNTLTTPRGGQFSVVLADGTKAWLNAASSITYPTQFTDVNREVTITGEVYLEVATSKAHPFLVKTHQQTVQVLGTRFNINAYTDEPATITTLLEGSIKVITGMDSTLVKPGQQAMLRQQHLALSPADVEEAVAWKNGVFQFDEENLESIMRKLSRWYDVDIEYSSPAIRQIPLTGIITHFSNVSQVLRMLELTRKVHFTIEEKKIIVYQN